MPLGVLFYFNLDQLSDKIAFARAEIAGDRFQQAAIHLVGSLANYREASLSQGSAAAQEREVEAAVHQLEEVNGEVAPALGFTQEALRNAGLENQSSASIRAKWDSVARAGHNAPSNLSPDQYEELLSAVRGLISHAGDTSNLTLDPEIDSYYLADVTSVTVAQSLSRIGSAMVMIASLGKGQTLPTSVRTQAAIDGSALKESDFDRITGDLETALKENAKSAYGPSPTLKASIEPVVAQYKADVQKLIVLLGELGQGKINNPDEFQQTAERAIQSTIGLSNKVAPELDRLLVTRINGFARYRMKVVLGTCITLGLALTVLFFAVRGITQPLAVAVAHVEKVALGDLSRELPASYLERGDEIGTLARAIKGMSAGLRTMIVTDFSQKATQTAVSVGEASTAVSQISDGARLQTERLKQVSAALTDSACAIKLVTSNAGIAREKAEAAARAGEQGQEAVAQLVPIVEAIAQNSRKINQITQVIAQIADRTHILSLNAAIEAARAGEHGKGFVVVAQEVGKLAESSAQNARQITNIVEQASNDARLGEEATKAVTQSIRSLAAGTIETSERVRSISVAMDEQQATISQIEGNVSELKDIALTNSAAAEEITATMIQLSQLSGAMRKSLGEFKTS